MLLVWSSHNGEEYLHLQWNLFPTNFVLFCWPKELWFVWISLVCLDYYSVFLFFFMIFFAKFFMSKNWKKRKKKPLKTLCGPKRCVYVLLASKVICFSFLGCWASLIGPTPPKKNIHSHIVLKIEDYVTYPMVSFLREWRSFLPPWCRSPIHHSFIFFSWFHT